MAIEYAKRESAVLTHLEHPNIIKVHHTAETETQFMIFMEYAGFGSNYLSKKVLLNQKAVREDKLQCWAQDVLFALSYIHERGVVHNDIKIDNILIQSQPEDGCQQEDEDELPVAKVIDFGLCNVVSQWDQYKPAGHQ